jgi:hypothetical protein
MGMKLNGKAKQGVWVLCGILGLTGLGYVDIMTRPALAYHASHHVAQVADSTTDPELAEQGRYAPREAERLPVASQVALEDYHLFRKLHVLKLEVLKLRAKVRHQNRSIHRLRTMVAKLKAAQAACGNPNP